MAVFAGGQWQAQIPFDSAEGRLSTRCARSGRQGLLEVEIRAVQAFRKSSVVGPARPRGRPWRMNLHDRSDGQRNQARFLNISLAKGLAASAQIASR